MTTSTTPATWVCVSILASNIKFPDNYLRPEGLLDSFYNLLEKLEDTKGVIRSRKSKDRQHNGQKKKDKRTNNDLQNITQKTKDQVT